MYVAKDWPKIFGRFLICVGRQILHVEITLLEENTLRLFGPVFTVAYNFRFRAGVAKHFLKSRAKVACMVAYNLNIKWDILATLDRVKKGCFEDFRAKRVAKQVA